MALRYRLLAFRVRPDEQDIFIDELCELGRLPATEAPSTPLGGLSGEHVLGDGFDDAGASALTWIDDVAVLVDAAFCIDLLTEGADAGGPQHETMQALSRGRDALAAWVGHGNYLLRTYRDGIVIREHREGAEQVDEAVRSFLGREVTGLRDVPFAVYGDDLAALRRFGAAAEWGRGVAAVFVPGAAGEELALARRLFGDVELSSDAPVSALDASQDHGFRDIAAIGNHRDIAMIYPGHYKFDHDTLPRLAATLATVRAALIVRWYQSDGNDSWFALLDHGRIVREVFLGGSSDTPELTGTPTPSEAALSPTTGFEQRLRAVCRDALRLSVASLFAPSIALQRIDVPPTS